MAKVKVHEINKKERYKIIEELFELIANLRTKQEVIEFLLGFLTSSEALMIARRLQIAKLLLKNETYDEIQRKMRVGHQTIAAVEKWLQYDEKKKGIIIKKIKEIKRYNNTDNTRNMLDRYSHHRFLKEIFQI